MPQGFATDSPKEKRFAVSETCCAAHRRRGAHGALGSLAECHSQLHMTPAKLTRSGAAFGFAVHLVVIFRTFVKKLRAPSPVMSCSPNLEREPSRPPKEKGSRGTGTPMLTPTIAAPKLRANQSAVSPDCV